MAVKINTTNVSLTQAVSEGMCSHGTSLMLEYKFS